MATNDRLPTRSTRLARTVAVLAVGLLVVGRAAHTGNRLLLAVGIVVLLARLALALKASDRVRLRDGELVVERAGIPRRFALSRLVSAELRGRALVLRSVDGKSVRVPLTGTAADAELVAQLREATAATGVSIPDPPPFTRRSRPSAAIVVAGIVGFVFALGVVLSTGAHGSARAISVSKAAPVTPASLASRNGTFTDPFSRVGTCRVYVVPLDVDSITHGESLAYELARLGTGVACVTHPLKLSPAVLDRDRRQLNTHSVLDELRAAYRRAHDDTPARVIGLTEFDLFSPNAPGQAFVTIDAAIYPHQTFGIGSTAHGSREGNYESIAEAFSG
jgi:hypothetical protein